MKAKILFFGLLIAGAGLIASCGNRSNTNNNTDSTSVGGADATGVTPDTAPGAEIPPGAINPGEDSSRYGTGTQDSSKERRPI